MEIFIAIVVLLVVITIDGAKRRRKQAKTYKSNKLSYAYSRKSTIMTPA